MKFFKTEDFEPSCGIGDPNKIWSSDAAVRANQKLEGCGARVAPSAFEVVDE